MKCLTHNCETRTHQSAGMWLGSRWICTPCWMFLTQGVGHNNQIVKNTNQIVENTNKSNSGTVFLTKDSRPI